MGPFFINDDHEWQDLGKGLKRKVMLWNDEIMAVAVCFEKDAVGTPHAHDAHSQIGYIVAGSFEAVSGTEKRILKAGDAYLADKNVTHGAVALEPNSIILDIFTPLRRDFLPS